MAQFYERYLPVITGILLLIAIGWTSVECGKLPEEMTYSRITPAWSAQ